MATNPVPFRPFRKTPPVVTAERKALAVATLRDPVLFAERMLQTSVWGTQAKILRSIKENGRTAVRACHASSKTFSAALAVLWFLARYKKSVVVTTAPTSIQVEKLLWGEIGSAIARSHYPYPEPLLTEIKFNSRRYAIGFSTAVTKSDEGVKFQGFHEEHVLVILDEAPGVHPKIWESVEGARAGGDVRLLALGNPTIGSGPFYDIFSKDREGWARFTISAFDTPNLEGLTLDDLLKLPEEDLDIAPRPYLVTRRWVKERYYEWGENHPSWESRVLGQFPSQSDDALISLAWIEKGKISDIAMPSAKARAGVDVGGPGDDETVLTIRRGPRIIEQKFWSISDPRGELVAALRPYHESGDLETVNIDSIGIGWGIHLHLLDLGFPSVPVNVGESPRDREKFVNLKAELYWGLRLRLQAGDFSGINDEKTVGQLAGIKYLTNSRGQILIESKEDARKRGVHSPDRAESVMLAFAEVGTGLTIYRAVFKERMIYTEPPIGLGNPGSYQERIIAVGYAVALGMCFLDILDTGSLIYVTREYYVDGATSSSPLNDAQYALHMQTFIKGENPLTGEKVFRDPSATVILSEEAENFGTELNKLGIYHLAADTELVKGVQMVGTVFERNMVRVHSSCRRFISEHKQYAWDSTKLARGIEEPVGTNKQAVEAFRLYVKTRLNSWRLSE